jgi:hypothetical protein
MSTVGYNMPDEEPVICEDVQIHDLRRLAANVVTQAIRDLKGRDIPRAVDAALFLTDVDDRFPWWAEWAGMSFADPFKLLTSGAIRSYKVGAR